MLLCMSLYVILFCYLSLQHFHHCTSCKTTGIGRWMANCISHVSLLYWLVCAMTPVITLHQDSLSPAFDSHNNNYVRTVWLYDLSVYIVYIFDTYVQNLSYNKRGLL